VKLLVPILKIQTRKLGSKNDFEIKKGRVLPEWEVERGKGFAEQVNVLEPTSFEVGAPCRG
jgi:hypothetical protein